ncbi:EAL domain-containing protein [bacterium]|nr:EAL domain-containing protein [bacterium]
MNSIIARVATALLIDYSSVYYIDPKTGFYECYSTNQGYKKLELHSSGKDFFADCQRDIKVVVCAEDRESVSAALTRESLLGQLQNKDAVSIVYRLMIDGNPVYHTMRILRDASEGDECLILGVLNVDESVRSGHKTRTYNAIAKTLADRYATIYYVDLATNHYVEYSASNDYKELEVPAEGSDFFSDTYKNVKRFIHPEDVERTEKIADKNYMTSVTENGRTLQMDYRLSMNGGIHYVRLMAVRTDDNNHLIIALENIDREKKNQEALKAISEKNVVFSQIAESLAGQYGMIYYIDTETDKYIEFTALQEYKKFNINPSGSDFFGTSQRNVSAIIHPADRERVFAALDRKTMMAAMQENNTFSITYRLMLPNGSSYTRMSVFWARDRKHLIMTVRDIEHEMAKEKALEKTLKENATFYQIAASLANQYDTIYYVDMLNDHYIEFSSTDVYKSLDVQPSGDDFFKEAIINIKRVIYPEDRAAFMHILEKPTMLQMLRDKHMITHTYRLMIGEEIMYARLSAIWATDNKHIIIGVMNIDREVRKEQEIAEKLYLANEKAHRDAMTGVKNKAAFKECEDELQRQIREGKAEDFAIAVCDVNGLKMINDTYGHKAGDEHIIKACRMICDIFQHSPVYRTGGDEFVVILSGRDYLIRRELVLALHDRSVEHIRTNEVVVSCGSSDYRPGEDIDFHSMFERADELMYKEKQLLKGMGSITREDAEIAAKPVFADENADILRLKRHILIVEDEHINRMMLGVMLEDWFELLYAADGVEALEQIRTHKEDLALVLLDLQIPKMSGMEVLKVVKGEKDLEDIPIIVMTAEQSAEVECLKIGAIDFIPKPYPSCEIVQARVNRCIELSEKRNIIETTERDSLTNLFNHDYFLRYVRIYDQYYADKPMDAMVLDVNNFHVLNERYGKQYGDSVLARIGVRVRQIAREVGGVGCRRGADTFLIYCPHREDYEALLDKASEGLAGEDVSENRVRLRMGVYSNVDKTLEIERRFDYAKVAANSVKSGYRKAVGIFDTDMHEAELYRARLLEDFKPSLQDRRFTVHFQPKFDIRPDKPVLSSAEALVRWSHPELGMISPGVFIPLLEDNGLILELDQFVWCEAAARIRDWKDRFGWSVPVSVNVSRIDMLTPNLTDIFKDILERYSLTTDDLILEITESAYTGDAEQVISTAKDLRGIGFRIEMDDFGTGYSSLGMLSHLPIDVLKLDMSFVRSAFGKNRDLRMIELIIDIADYLHVPIVAEGVETEEQYLVLKTMGCDFVQGYYFSKPVAPEAFDRFLIERAEIKTEITPAQKKAYMSVSKALTGGFESVFYVDLVTDCCIEFCVGSGGELEIRPGGADLFCAAREKMLEGVNEADAQKLGEALAKANLIRLAEQEEAFALSFRKEKNVAQISYSLQTVKTRESDNHHIVIGLKPE